MMTISYTPEIIATGSEGDPNALWDQRISTIPGATRPIVDDLERKLFAGLGASIRVSRIIRGTPGWWLAPESGETAHHVDLVDVVANPGGAFDTRNEIVEWVEGVVGRPVRVAIRFDVDGDLEVLATDGVEVFVVDERVPDDRVYRMPSEHTSEDIDLLIGSSPVRSSRDYCDPISALRNPKVEMGDPEEVAAEEVEEAAQLVWKAMKWSREAKGHEGRGDVPFPEWVPGSNSDAQYEARRAARRILEAGRTPS